MRRGILGVLVLGLVGMASIGGTPQLYGEELPTEVTTIVYVIDCSCSMDSGWQSYVDEDGNQVSGYRMDRAKSEVCPSILQLPETFWFDVVSTDIAGYALFGHLAEASGENKSAACSHVQGLSGGGETGLAPAAAWALSTYEYHDVFDYVIVTGGVPSCCVEDSATYWEDALNQLRGANERNARIHVVVITPDPEDHVLTFAEAITQETGGTLTVLSLDDSEEEEEED